MLMSRPQSEQAMREIKRSAHRRVHNDREPGGGEGLPLLNITSRSSIDICRPLQSGMSERGELPSRHWIFSIYAECLEAVTSPDRSCQSQVQKDDRVLGPCLCTGCCHFVIY